MNQDIPDKDLLARYIRRAFQKNIKLSSIKGSCGCNIQFLLYLRDRGKAGLGDLHRSHIEGFVERQQDRGLNPRTINTQLACIYAFIRFLVNQGHASAELLVRKVAIQVPRPLPKDIPRDDEDLLLSVIDDTRDRAMILLLLRTGMRIGEVLATRMSDINLKMQAITIIESEKTGSERLAYFSNNAAEALYDWLMIRDCSQDHLFFGRGRKPLNYAAAGVMFLKYIDEAGLSYKWYTLHSMHHTLATSLYSIKQFVIWLQISIEKVTHQDMSPYIDYVLSRHTSPQTINSSLFRIRGFYDYLHYDKRLKIKSPVRRGMCLRLPKPLVFGQSLLPLPLVPYKKY